MTPDDWCCLVFLIPSLSLHRSPGPHTTYLCHDVSNPDIGSLYQTGSGSLYLCSVQPLISLYYVIMDKLLRPIRKVHLKPFKTASTCSGDRPDWSNYTSGKWGHCRMLDRLDSAKFPAGFYSVNLFGCQMCAHLLHQHDTYPAMFTIA